MSFQVFQAQGLRIFSGDTATCAGYTGNAGEISVNTETKAVYVHDGLTAGGTPLTTAEQAELLGMTLGQLANVELDSPSDGQVLVYDEAAEVWKNELVAGAGGGAVDLDGLNDVELANPADNQVLTYNQGLSKWENKEVPQADISNLYTKTEVDSFVQSKSDQTHVHDDKYQVKGNYLTNTSKLGEVSDVQITTPANDQVLSYNASTSKWENVNLDNTSLGGTVVAVKHAVVTGRKDIRQQNCYPYGLAITHTPAKATNKILLMAYIHHSTTYVTSFGFSRNGASIGHESSNNANANNSIATNYWGQIHDSSYMLSTSYSYLDSPNSTSALTYNATACSSWGGTLHTLRINDRSSEMLSRSSMVLMEIEP